MSLAARKTRQFSIVRPGSRSDEPTADTPPSLKEFFTGWLDSVAPELSREQLPNAPPVGNRQRPISTTDIVRVNRATVRESTDHRHWPAEVVLQFLTAEVITRKNKRG
jgi:hypothetical protein